MSRRPVLVLVFGIAAVAVIGATRPQQQQAVEALGVAVACQQHDLNQIARLAGLRRWVGAHPLVLVMPGVDVAALQLAARGRRCWHDVFRPSAARRRHRGDQVVVGRGTWRAQRGWRAARQTYAAVIACQELSNWGTPHDRR